MSVAAMESPVVGRSRDAERSVAAMFRNVLVRSRGSRDSARRSRNPRRHGSRSRARAEANASAERVRALYEDPSNWARIFPATIRGARVARRQGDTTVIEVDHVEGRVTNILRAVSSTRIDLAEIKRRYEATFANEFIGEGDGMRYQLTASVCLKWPYRLVAPFVKPLVLARMRRYVVDPLKAAAEIDR